MNEQRIEEIKNALREMVRLIVESGQPVSDQVKQRLVQAMEHAATRISELRQEARTPPPQEAPPQQPPSPPSRSPSVGAAPSPDAQLLWILAGQNEQAFLEYLTTYPTPETQSLLGNPSELQRVVGYLNQMMPPGEPMVLGGMPHSDLNSSTIWGTQYDPKSGQMKVRFQGGAEYVYQGIPPNIYRAFSQGQASAKTQGSNDYGAWWVGKNPSLGAALNQYIKAGGFPYQRIN